MLEKYILCLVVCVITCNVKAADDEQTVRQYNEIPCLSFGGICVPSNDCRPGNLASLKGLCPEQQRFGVECCHGLPKSATGCHDQGGECFPGSYRCATLTKASDCAAGENCCILI